MPKTTRHNVEKNSKSNITPTVELNALAMKLGKQTHYILDPMQKPPNENITTVPPDNIVTQQHNLQQYMSFIQKNVKKKLNFNDSRSYHVRYPTTQTELNNKLSTNPTLLSYMSKTGCAIPCKITLIVGSETFTGFGKTLQQAKHDAASRAIIALKENLQVLPSNEKTSESFSGSDTKSPISQVFEIGLKRNLPVDFKVLREEGPAHMRLFTTACIVGSMTTEADGTGKKASKKNAAQKMLIELQKLPEPSLSPIKVEKQTKKKIKINMKDCNASRPAAYDKPNKQQSSINMNPIARLLEWHKDNNEKEPYFKLVTETNNENPHRRQFVIEASTKNVTARGVGSSKKVAKRNAAQSNVLHFFNFKYF